MEPPLAVAALRAPPQPRCGPPDLALYEQAHVGEAAEGETTEEEEEGDFYTDISMVDEQSLYQNRSCDDLVNISDLCDSNQEYYRKLEELKEAHMKTMAKLEKMYQNKLHLKGVLPETRKKNITNPCFSSVWIEPSYQPTILQKSFSEPDLNQPSSISVSDVSESGFSNLETENMNEVKMSAFAKEYIRNMWNNFSVKDYVYIPSGSSDSPIIKKREKKPKVWVPKITVPEPFQMTIREDRKKEESLKSQAEKRMALKLLKKQEEKLAQAKNFRANPVPESVFLPLYHEILEQNEARKRIVKERSREILLASQKPFTFIAREEQKKEARQIQLTTMPEPEKKKNPFRAKPVPRSTYSLTLSDRIREEEFFRDIRVHMRAQELLQNSSLPRNMKAHQSPSKRKPKQPEQGEKAKDKVKYPVPNFKILHTKLQKQLQEQRNPRPTTVCQPFDLLTLRIPSKKEKILEDIQADEERLKETRWPYLSPRGKVRGRHSKAEPPLCESSETESPRPTLSSRRRQQAIRKSLEEKKTLEEERKRNLAKQRQKLREWQKLLMARARAADTHQSLAQMSKSRTTMLRKNEKERRKEYLQELEEIEKRLKKRPLLFERVAQKNARMSAEKHYSNTLRDLGLCVEFVSKEGQNAEYLTEQEIENCTEDEVSIDEDKIEEPWEENDQDDIVSQDGLH